MNARGHYGKTHQPNRVHVGALLVHTLELKQRYNHVNTAAAQALLNDLSRDGVASTVGPNRWEIALKDGAWVILTLYPDWSALEITITDRELRRVDQAASVRRRYEAILRKITPRLISYGATTVGSATYAGQAPTDPRLVARTRAVRAVFNMYTSARAPYYLYAEVNGVVDKRFASTLDEANALFAALERSAGTVYVAIFDPTDTSWPGPALDVYHGAPQAPGAVIGLVRSPTEIDDELDELHNEVMAFGTQLQEQVDRNRPTETPEIRAIHDEYLRLKKQEDTWLPLKRDVERIQAQLEASANPFELGPELQKAQMALEKHTPRAKREEVIARLREIADRLSSKRHERGSEDPIFRWSATVYEPFASNWISFRAQKKDVPLQTLPGTGTWDRIQEYRQQFVDLYNSAPFKPTGPKPLDPSGRKDPSILGSLAGALGSAGSIVKWTLIGILGIGGAVALSSVVANVRKGRDPVEHYTGIYRGRKTQLALPPGEGV